MKKSRQTKLLSLLVSVGAVGCFAACGTKSKKNGPASIPPEKDLASDVAPVATTGPGSTNDPKARLAAFEEILRPKLNDYCGTCHGVETAPKMATDNALASLVALEEAKKIDYVNPAASRIVQRLSVDGHNCWGQCSDNTTEMLDALKAFVEKLKAAGALPPVEKLKQTDMVAFNTAVDGPATQLEGTYVQLATSGGAVSGAMTIKSDDPDELITSYMSSLPVAPATTASLGSVTYTFDVTVAGTYTVWAKIKSATNANNQLRVSVDGATAVLWTTITSGTDWMWDGLRPAGAAVNGTVLPTPQVLTVGSHTITISTAAGGRVDTRFNSVALSSLTNNFQGGLVATPSKVIKVPLKNFAPDKNAFLTAEVKEYNAKTKTIQIRNLRVITDKQIKIKGIKPLINGVFDPRDATYTTLSVDVAPNTAGTLISGAPLILAGDGGFATDKLSFSIDEVN